jgi:hypothetical protein
MPTQIVFVKQRYPRLIAGGIRWIKRELGKESLAGGITRSDLFELYQIRAPNIGIFMDTIEVRFVPETSSLQFGGQEGTVVADRVGETPCVFLAGLYRAERGKYPKRKLAQSRNDSPHWVLVAVIELCKVGEGEHNHASYGADTEGGEGIVGRRR